MSYWTALFTQGSMMMMKSLIKAAALFVVLSAAVPSMAAEGWLEGDEFPNITLTTEDGRSLTISDFRGRWSS